MKVKAENGEIISDHVNVCNEFESAYNPGDEHQSSFNLEWALTYKNFPRENYFIIHRADCNSLNVEFLELSLCIRKLKDNKSPGLDKITNEILKLNGIRGVLLSLV